MESFNNNSEFGKLIKSRRHELNLTIEQAAKKAGVGTKTWSRYEAGNPIRKDKVKGVLRVLQWRNKPSQDSSTMTREGLIKEYRNHNAWSNFIYENFGLYATISFIMGSEILTDYIKQDLEELSSLPVGTHIGQIDFSMLSIILPKEYLMKYDYNFLYSFHKSLQNTINHIISQESYIAHKPINEIILYLIVNESRILMEEIESNLPAKDRDDFSDWDEWIFDVFDDSDVELFLFSEPNLFVPEDYQFVNWFNDQFYI